MNTSAIYRIFAEYEARGTSPRYEMLALGVSESREVCDLLDGLPPHKRQPNLLLAAVRVLNGPSGDWDEFRRFVLDQWDQIGDLMATRSTQTNEAGRCGAFLPVLAQLGCSISLIEVGPSAGLCLYPDRYAYDYDGTAVGTSSLRIPIDCAGPVPVPQQLPDIRWRAGIDLNPLDVTSVDDMAWLQACIWPEHERRRERLEAARAIAAADPPHLVKGDLVSETTALLDQAPADTLKVLFHSAVLAYLDPEDRQAFIMDTIRPRDDVIWLSNEAPGVLPGLDCDAQPPAHIETAARFHLAIGGTRVLALTDPHGAWLSWLP